MIVRFFRPVRRSFPAWLLVNVAYDEVTKKFNEVKFVTMDAGYKTPWIAKNTIEDGRVPVLPYTRYTGRQDRYKPWEYTYDPANDTYTCFTCFCPNYERTPAFAT